MAVIWKDRVRDTSLTSGTLTTITNSGTAPANYRSLSGASYAVNDTFAYVMANRNASNEWETGIGINLGSNQWSRSAARVFDGSSGAGALINWSSGTKDFAVTREASYGTRQTLATNTTFYVSPSGSDTTGDGSVGNPWRQITFAMSVVSGFIDGGPFNVTIQAATGAYDPFVFLPTVGSGTFLVNGDTVTPTNCTISNSTDFVTNLTMNVACIWTVAGFALNNTAATFCPNIGVYAGKLTVQNMQIGNSPTLVTTGQFGSLTIYAGTITVVGSGTVLFYASGGIIQTAGATVNFPSPVTYSSTTYGADTLGIIYAYSTTFGTPGNVTGVRYNVATNAIIQTFGGGATYLPGSIAGSASTGGIYA